jgi:hypothetical protein
MPALTKVWIFEGAIRLHGFASKEKAIEFLDYELYDEHIAQGEQTYGEKIFSRGDQWVIPRQFKLWHPDPEMSGEAFLRWLRDLDDLKGNVFGGTAFEVWVDWDKVPDSQSYEEYLE